MTLETNHNSSDVLYFKPYTMPTHLTSLVSTDPRDCPLLPIPHKANPPEVIGFTDIEPERMGTDLGQLTSFKAMPDDYEIWKKMTLIVTFSQLAAGGAGTLPRYPDDVLCQAIDWIDFDVAGFRVQRIFGEQIHFNQLRTMPPEEYGRVSRMQRAGLMPANRAALAATVGGFQAYLEIPFWFTENFAKAWHQYSCQRQTRIFIQWRQKEYVLQQDGVNTFPTPVGSTTYIKSMFLRVDVSIPDVAVKETFLKSVIALGDYGLDILSTHVQWQDNNPVPPGSYSFNIKLQNFNKPIYLIQFIVRPTANLIPNYTNNQRLAIVPVSYFNMYAASHKLTQDTSHDWAMWKNEDYWLGWPSVSQYVIPFAENTDITNYPMGCLDFSLIQNPNMNFYWKTPTPTDYTIDVRADYYNYVRLIISSDLRSAVTLEQPQ